MISIIVTSIGYFEDHIIPLYKSFSRYGDFEFILVLGDRASKKSRSELTNKGLAAATGDWLLVLDSDVRCEGDYNFINELPDDHIYGTEIHNMKMGRDIEWLNEPVLLIPRSLYEEIGGFDENFKTSMAFGGCDYSIRAKKAGWPVKYLDAPFVHLAANTSVKITENHGETRNANLKYICEKWDLQEK